MTDREKTQAIERQIELDDIRAVMATVEGRRFMWRFLEAGNIFRKCFTGNSSTFYNEGKRELTLGFYADVMEAAPELFWKAQKENTPNKGQTT